MPSWKKVIISGSDASLNKLNISTALTASGINYPTTDGTPGQGIVTDGSGNLSFTTITSGTTTDTGSLLTTASAAGSTITFEKGDGSTFDISITSDVTPANALVTASLAGSTLTFEKGDTSTFNITLPAGGYSGSNATAHLYQTVAASTWSFAHNLDDRYPVFTVYDNNGDIIIPNKVQTVDKDNANIYFSTARTGTATAVIASSISQISSVTADFTNQTTVAVTHSLDTRNIHVSVYDTNHALVIPESIVLDTLDTVVVTFPVAKSGTVVVAKGGHIISGSAATAVTASYIEYANVANKPTLISSSAQIASDISGSLTSFSGSIVTRVENLENFSSSLNATFVTDAELAAVSGAIASDIVEIIDGTQIIASASYALTASYGENFVISGSINLNGYTWPTIDGTYGVEVLTTDGAGGLSFEIPTNVYETVKNVSGGPLVKGTPVHATGSATLGNVVGVIAADALDPTKMPATYILHQNLADEEEGLGIAVGFITGVDTRGLIEGEPVYVAPGGGWTQTKPTGSALIQNLGIVTKVAENGSGVVLGAGRSNDVPNITQGYAWVGNVDQVATATPTASFFVTSGSHALSADDAISSSFAVFALDAAHAATADQAINSDTLDNLDSTQFLRSDQTGVLTGDLTVTGTITAQEFHTELISASIVFQSGSTQFGNSADDIHVFTGSVNIDGAVIADSFTGSIAIGEDNTLTIGSQRFFPQGNNGFSVNEDFDPSNSSLQTAYHFTSGTGRETVAFTLARTGQFTDGFGIYGTAANNTFVMFGEQNNTSFEWRRGVGIRPLDLDGGTLLARLNTAGQFSANSISASSGITGSLLGTALTATSASYALTASYALNVPVTASYALTASYVDPTYISASAAASGFGQGGVTSIIAGSGISINQGTGDVTITALAASGSQGQNVIAPFAFAFVNTTSNGSGTGISWGNWNGSNYTLDFTFATAQPNTNYSVITDSETFDDYFVGISNKTTTGFRAEFYDNTQSRTPSTFSPFTFFVYGSDPVASVGVAVTGSLLSTGSLSSNTLTFTKGDGTTFGIDLTSIQPTSASYALTASFVEFSNIANKPTLISSSLQFNTFNTPFTGSFTGSFFGDGSNLSGVTSYTDADTLAYINSLGVLSGSAQIDSDISGAFASTSSSLAQRIAAQENFSSSLDATFATDAELSAVSGALALSISSISTDFADITNKPTLISSSLQFNTLDTPFTGSFTGSFYGDGTGLTGLGYGDTKKLNQTVAATTWSFSHNMNEQYPTVTVYNTDNEVIQPSKIEAQDEQTLKLYFGIPTAGTAVAVVGGVALTQEAGFNRVLSIGSAATTWSFAHNLGQKYPQFEVYDSNDELIIPGRVQAIDQNNAVFYFDTPQAGTVAATVGGTASTASYADTLLVTDILLSSQKNTDVATGTETVATVSTSLYDGAFFDYVIKDGTNYRAGTIMAVWDGSSVQYTETSTADIGSTSVVTMAVDISGTDARLRATTTTGNWNIKAFVRAL